MKKKNKNGYTKGLKRAFEKYRWWDYSFMIDFEREIWKHWLCVYSSPEKYHVVGLSPRRVSIAKLALSLLDAWSSSIVEKVDPDDDLRFEKKDDDSFSLVHMPEYKLMSGKYVNTRNAQRFMHPHRYDMIKDKDGEIKAFHLEDLYQEKAWQLYHRLKAQYLFYMWD